MKTKILDEYEKACAFCDEVDGQIEWSRYRKNIPFMIIGLCGIKENKYDSR